MSKKIQKVISVATSVATIAWISGIAALAPLAASAAVVGINDGDTIRVANTFDVYIVKYVGSKQFKRLILNPQVFNSYGHLSWAKVKTVTQSQMDQFTNSDLVRALGDTKVYKLIPNGDMGTKQWVNMTAEQFTAGGYDWDSIYVINNVDRDNYTTGSDITGGTSTSPSTSVSGGALTVALASDTPAAGVAVKNAAKIPFTKVNFTAGSENATITGLTVQRTGLADDGAFSSLVLVDAATNLQVGLSQTLNASHQVLFTTAITIPANTTKSYILAGNMGDTSSYAGQVASLSLVAVTAGGSVSGVLPITGNGQTINSTLTIGTATVTAGSLDPSTHVSKSVGTTGYNFSSIKVTATSEDETISSIMWNQSGSAATSDLGNVVVSDGTTNYATTVSSDGKYYTVSFGAGLVITKGNSKEFTIKGDLLSGSARTISFDIYRNTDITIKGNTYGYYITPSFTGSGSAGTDTYLQASSSPYFGGADVTVGAGSLRVDSDSTLAPATNITRGASNQVLGGFDFVVQGEAVNVQNIRLDLNNTGTGRPANLTNVVLTKTDGTVIASGGTVSNDASNSGSIDYTVDGHVSFSGTMTFPVGTTQVLVKGNLDTTFVNNDTFVVGFGTTGAGTNITNITGSTTGNSITATPSGAVWSSIQTVKGGALSASIQGTPVSQTVIKGAQNFVFANLLLDATNSGEDIRVTQIQVTETVAGGAAVTDITSFGIYDGTTLLTSGSNLAQPVTGTTAYTLTLDSPLVITKNTQKTLAIKGNVSSNATAGDGSSTYSLKLGLAADSGGQTVVKATGVSTTSTITVSGVSAAQLGQAMYIVAGGTYTVALDSSTPTGKLIAANTTGNIMTVLRFHANNETINVNKVTLALTNASSSVNDLTQVYLYNASGALLASGALGRAGASGGTSNNASTTFTLSTPLVVDPTTDATLTVKADVAPIYTTNTVATAGHQVSINFYGAGADSTVNSATGVSSGGTITTASTTTSQTAAFLFKSLPTVTVLAVPNTKLAAGVMTLYRVQVAADAKGDIDLDTLSFTIATTTATVTSLNLFNVSASPEAWIHANTTGVASNTTVVHFMLKDSAAQSTETPVTITAGTSKIFELRGTVGASGLTTGSSVSTALQGDAAAPTALNGGMRTASQIQADTNADFIWSDWSKASHLTTTADWMNGYLVPGLPSSAATSAVISY